MPVSTLIATPGSATANSYVTVAVADQYHLDRPPVGTTWADATTDQKTAAILWATKLLDRYYEWYGSVVDSTQKLLWPRSGLVDVNNWTALDTMTIPEQIQWATAEFARQLLADDRTGDSDVERMKIRLLKVGSIRLDFDSDVYSKPIPDAVKSLIPESWGCLKSSSQVALERW